MSEEEIVLKDANGEVMTPLELDASSDEEETLKESSQINLDVLNDLKTGDLLLFNDNSSGLFGWFKK